ncbi:MAG: peptide ABC transporter ATP-binding protein [Candidatus Cloacimonadota bacterium]|nr:MAG: peptide ABC transporter ATP-binding protein [Candidatus Cloacimonadota bacterium]
MSKDVLLEVKGLKTYFNTEAGVAKAVNGVDYEVYKGEVLGIVGESGSGKSVTSLSIMRLIPEPPGFIDSGEIIFEGQDLLKMSYPEMRKIRGNDISMIFQEPMTSLNPVLTIGAQIMEPLILHQKLDKIDAADKAARMLELVGIPGARERLFDYPHQFSGGMRQRVMIAMALACNPKLLIADEPTTALDVTIQAQILELMLKIKDENEDSSIILITHDMAVVAEICDRVVVLYCGKVQEIASVDDIFHNPKHPYTQGLLNSIPNPAKKVDRLYAIPGVVPNLMELPKGCKFCTRCDYAIDICKTQEPELKDIGNGHMVRCHLDNGNGYSKK